MAPVRSPGTMLTYGITPLVKWLACTIYCVRGLADSRGVDMRAEVEELQAARTQLKKDVKAKQRQLDDEKRENDKVRGCPGLGKEKGWD